MRAGLFSVLAIVAACNAPGRSPATEIPASELCRTLAAHEGWPQAVADAEERWGVPAPLLLGFLRQESHFKSDKRHASTPGPYGYPQAVALTWAKYRKETGNLNASRNNFAASVDFVGWYASATNERTGAPYSAVIKHYLAYSRGPAAKGPASPAALKNAAKVAAFAKAYETDLEACPLPKRRDAPVFEAVLGD